jgi:hypothetical protein
MDISAAAALPVDPGDSVLPTDEPFTTAMAATAGVDRAMLDRLRRSGRVRRLLRGVYVDSTVLDSTQLRARAMSHLVDRRRVAVDRSAAWVHGLTLPSLGTAPGRRAPAGVPVETLLATRPVHGSRGASRALLQRDVESIEGLRVTTPLRTAVDLGRTLPAGLGLATLDWFLAQGRFTHHQLLGELSRMTGHRGVGQLRELAAQADGRSACVAESVLRLAWHRARLPTATPGLVVAAGSRAVRLALGVERRQFGAVLTGAVTAADLVALEARGWRVVPLSEARVLATDPEPLRIHLEREFHQHLLDQLD